MRLIPFREMIMKIGFIAFCLMLCTCLFCLQVGGHITSDTTWSPEYNPYEVIHNIYVDSGVTLSIQPGTIVKLSTSQNKSAIHKIVRIR